MEWGLLVSAYLFLGGMSAGLFCLSAAATLAGRWPDIARLGALLAPWPVMAGTLLLVFDLGKWYRFYKLLLHFRSGSLMSIGTWLLSLFIVVALAYLALPRWRRKLAMVGLPLAIGVAVYTGLLLGVLQARPFWNTNLIAQLFLVSALSAGSAVLMLALRSREEILVLRRVEVALLALEVLIVLAFVGFGRVSLAPVREAMAVILGGPLTVLFWCGFFALGLVAPLTASLLGRAHTAAAILTLAGGLLLRSVVVFGGQMA
jgi:formate-dependent nitrite reductase membrane component NrfD